MTSVASIATCLLAEIPMRNERPGGGEETPSPYTGNQKCRGLYTGWKRISRHEEEWEESKIRVGEAFKTVGWLKGESNTFAGL